jgi:hypothetical protein
VLWLVPAALAWPADGEWASITWSEEGMGDDIEDVEDRGLDLVGNDAYPALLWASDDETLWFRLRVNQDPAGSTGAWGVVMELDQDESTFEAALAASSSGAVRLMRADGAEGIAATLEELDSYGSQALRTVEADSDFRGDADWFVDLEMPVADLDTWFEVDLQWSFCVIPATSSTTSVAEFDQDLGAGRSDVEASWSDPFAIDFDIDGLSRSEELLLGSDPRDRDSDDDGLVDGHEVDLGADPTHCDSDGDGLLDGLELSVLEGDVGTDEEAGCFVVDADPDTSTDPADPDTDGGGLLDGQEDVDLDGAVGALELDPLDPDDDVDTDQDGVADFFEDLCQLDEGSLDDADSDGDGLLDAEEGVRDPEPDGDGAFCDLDADGDGLLDADEGLGDPDGDGVGNFLDTDSDGDGALDADEGDVDSDGDGLPDYLDEHDQDGPLGDADGDGLSNQDEQTCATDPDDPDSDDDGLLDGEEACRGDEDCDGVPDPLDGVDDDFCPEDRIEPEPPGGGCPGGCGGPGQVGLVGLAGLLLLRRRQAAVH